MSADAYQNEDEGRGITADSLGDGAPPDPESVNANAATATAEEAAEPDRLPLDVTFDILKNERRRLVLEYLRNADETVTIGELAEHIAAIENETTVQQLNAQQRKRVYIGLYQCHLPKMDDAGVVEFNQSRGLITLEAPSEALFRYLDVDAETEPETEPRYYGALSIGTGVLFLAAHVAGAPPAVSGGVFVLLVAAVAAIVLRRSDAVPL